MLNGFHLFQTHYRVTAVRAVCFRMLWLQENISVSKLLVVSGFVFFGVSCAVMADENNPRPVDGVEPGATRVIYPSDSKGVTLRVNNTADHPFLVKSVVLDESMQHEAPFIITPPLFRLDGGQRNTLNITRTGGNFPPDRESINWVCVQSIPPEPDAAWAEDKSAKDSPDRNKPSVTVQTLPNNCIKLLVRPGTVQGSPVDMADKVKWATEGRKITASNPTPFYINISKISVNGKNIKMGKTYIPPFSEEKYPLPERVVKNSTVKWVVLGDYGEEKEKTGTVN